MNDKQVIIQMRNEIKDLKRRVDELENKFKLPAQSPEWTFIDEKLTRLSPNNKYVLIYNKISYIANGFKNVVGDYLCLKKYQIQKLVCRLLANSKTLGGGLS